MENEYDLIVVGAGNGGLMAALTIAEKGKKVLLLEKNSVPGGLATSFVRGRFEFESSLRMLHKVGSDKDKGLIRKLFDEYELNEKIEWVEIPDAFRLIKMGNHKEDYTFPFGLDEFVKKMEQYVPESKEALTAYFETAKEIHEAYELLKTDPTIEDAVIKKTYPNYYNNVGKSVSEVFKKSKLPEKIKEILSACWIYFGVSTLNLDYTEYISFLYEYLTKKAYIPKNRSNELSLAIERKIINYGGRIWYNETADRILVENNKVLGVSTKSGHSFIADSIIVNSSPTNVYTKMIDSTKVPQDTIKLINSRKLGLRAMTIYLGLNKSPDDLNIKNYTFLLYNSLDSNIEVENLNSINSTTMIATCLNVANKTASVDGTTILTLTAFYNEEVWDKVINEENYYFYKEKIALKLIEAFENAADININDHIEEIEISTPLTYSIINSSLDGCVYGYKESAMDNKLLRILNKGEDSSINGLNIVGSYSYYSQGYDSTYLNGHEVALKVLNDMEGVN